jgi:hypothetical protein
MSGSEPEDLEHWVFTQVPSISRVSQLTFRIQRPSGYEPDGRNAVGPKITEMADSFDWETREKERSACKGRITKANEANMDSSSAYRAQQGQAECCRSFAVNNNK